MSTSHQRHPFHLVSQSPWPFLAGLGSLSFVLSIMSYLHGWNCEFFLVSLIFQLFVISCWSWDVIKEGTYLGYHTHLVQRGLRIGVVLFIVSEIMFFFSFFWAFFHSSLSPAIQIGCIWPPEGIIPFDPWAIPLLNTFILLLSGLTITICHHYLTAGNYSETVDFYLYTLFLAILFTCFQFYEYSSSTFSINDGIYGSTFFMTTGLHGAHVLLGTFLILLCFFRTIFHHFTTTHHIGFEAAAWYWHFVDVVWLFLFVAIYWWGGL